MEKHSIVDNEKNSSFFIKPKSFLSKGKLVSLESPLIMTVLNITPDSFYERLPYPNDIEFTVKKVAELLPFTDILDLGAVSTRPGAKSVTEKEELLRLLPHLEAIVKNFPDLCISVDTFRSGVAKTAVEMGASIINDVSAGEMDPLMFDAVARLKVPYIMMHMKGTPENMQQNPQYEDVIPEIMFYFATKLEQLNKRGLSDIIIDPGFGFGKSIDDNYKILNHLDEFRIFELPLLVGFSRKSMIQKVLGVSGEGALTGTTVLNTIAITKGANILRVHDPKEARQVCTLIQKLRSV